MTFAAMYSVELYIMVKIENFPKQLRQTPLNKKIRKFIISFNSNSNKLIHVENCLD